MHYKILKWPFPWYCQGVTGLWEVGEEYRAYKKSTVKWIIFSSIFSHLKCTFGVFTSFPCTNNQNLKSWLRQKSNIYQVCIFLDSGISTDIRGCSGVHNIVMNPKLRLRPNSVVIILSWILIEGESPVAIVWTQILL